jgi:hypothetical protein
MVGIFVEPWTRLPIEAAVLWGAAAWSNIAIYEFFRLRGEARTMNEVTPP